MKTHLWRLGASVLVASALWLSLDWLAESRVSWISVLYVPAGFLAVILSPNVHSPSDLLLWLAMTLQTFAMISLVAVLVRLARGRRRRA